MQWDPGNGEPPPPVFPSGSCGETNWLGISQPPLGPGTEHSGISYSAGAAVTKSRRARGVNSAFFAHSRGGWKSKIQAWAGRVCRGLSPGRADGRPLPVTSGGRPSACACAHARACVLVCFKNTGCIRSHPTLLTSFYLNHLF